jgi:hypothetical protein
MALAVQAQAGAVATARVPAAITVRHPVVAVGAVATTTAGATMVAAAMGQAAAKG